MEVGLSSQLTLYLTNQNSSTSKEHNRTGTILRFLCHSTLGYPHSDYFVQVHNPISSFGSRSFFMSKKRRRIDAYIQKILHKRPKETAQAIHSQPFLKMLLKNTNGSSFPNSTKDS